MKLIKEQDQNMRRISSKTDRIVMVSFIQTELQKLIFSVIFFYFQVVKA